VLSFRLLRFCWLYWFLWLTLCWSTIKKHVTHSLTHSLVTYTLWWTEALKTWLTQSLVQTKLILSSMKCTVVTHLAGIPLKFQSLHVVSSEKAQILSIQSGKVIPLGSKLCPTCGKTSIECEEIAAEQHIASKSSSADGADWMEWKYDKHRMFPN